MEDSELQKNIVAGNKKKSTKKGRNVFSHEADAKLVNLVHNYMPKGYSWAGFLKMDKKSQKQLFIHSVTGFSLTGEQLKDRYVNISKTNGGKQGDYMKYKAKNGKNAGKNYTPSWFHHFKEDSDSE